MTPAPARRVGRAFVRGVRRLRQARDTLLHGLTGRLLVAFLAIGLLPLSAALWAAVGLSEDTLRQQMIGRLSALAESRVEAIETWFLERRRAAQLLAWQPEIRRTLAACASGNTWTCASRRSSFRSFLEIAEFDDLMLISTEGRIVFSVSQWIDVGALVTGGLWRHSALAEVFHEARAKLVPVVSRIAAYPGSDDPAIFVATPVLDRGRVTGVLVLRLINETFYAQTTAYGALGRSGETVVVIRDRAMALVVAPLRHISGAAFRLSVPLTADVLSLPLQDAAVGRQGDGPRTDYRGEAVIAAWRHLPSLNGGLVVKMDAAEVFAPLMGLRRWMMLVTLAALLAVAVAAVLVSRTISRPIKRLTRAAQAVAAGDLNQRVPESGEDEISVFAATFNRMTTDLARTYDTIEQEVLRRTEALQRETETSRRLSRQIVESIEYGSRIQQALLPDPAVLTDRTAELAVSWLPRDVVGGDIYWWHPTPDGFLLVLADCTGHGVPGAFMTIIVSSCLNALTDAPEAQDPAWLLDTLNSMVKRSLRQTRARRGPDDGLDAAACVVSRSRAELRFAGARLGLIVRETPNDPWRDIRGDAVSIGYARSPEGIAFQTHRLSLASGLTGVLVTDGLFDQIGGGRGRPLGRSRFLEILAEATAGAEAQGLSAAVGSLIARVESWRGDLPVLDDRTVLAFRLDPTTPRPADPDSPRPAHPPAYPNVPRIGPATPFKNTIRQKE